MSASRSSRCRFSRAAALARWIGRVKAAFFIARDFAPRAALVDISAALSRQFRIIRANRIFDEAPLSLGRRQIPKASDFHGGSVFQLHQPCVGICPRIDGRHHDHGARTERLSFPVWVPEAETDLILPFVRFWCLLAAAIAMVSLVPAMLALWIIYRRQLVSRRAFVVAGSLIGAGTFSVGTALIVLAERGRFDTAPTENETIAVTRSSFHRRRGNRRLGVPSRYQPMNFATETPSVRRDRGLARQWDASLQSVVTSCASCFPGRVLQMSHMPAMAICRRKIAIGTPRNLQP